MDTSFIDPNPAFARIAFSISRAPESWEGWLCLQMDMQPESLSRDAGGRALVESVLASCFKGTDHKAFFVRNHIHVLCKGLGAEAMKDLGAQICDLRFKGHAVFAHYRLYEFGQDAAAFIADLHEKKAYAGNSAVLRVKLNPDNVYRNAKVLLIEDDPITRLMVSNALKDQCALVTASCANKAFAHYVEWKPDLVFLDIGLPDKDGRDVLDWILNNDPGANVIMFSGDSSVETITAALERGAKGFVAKPFLKESLFHYINSYTGAT